MLALTWIGLVCAISGIGLAVGALVVTVINYPKHKSVKKVVERARARRGRKLPEITGIGRAVGPTPVSMGVGRAFERDIPTTDLTVAQLAEEWLADIRNVVDNEQWRRERDVAEIKAALDHLTERSEQTDRDLAESAADIASGTAGLQLASLLLIATGTIFLALPSLANC